MFVFYARFESGIDATIQTYFDNDSFTVVTFTDSVVRWIEVQCGDEAGAKQVQDCTDLC